MSHRKVGTAHAAAGFRREIVQVDVFVNQDDVTRENLRRQIRRRRRNNFLVKIVPEDFLLQVRIHTGER